METETAATEAPRAANILAFNRWGVDGIQVEDQGLHRYISLEPRIVPRTGARHAGKRFHKSRMFIVERLMNKMMVPGHRSRKHTISSGHNTGQSQQVYERVVRAFRIIEEKTKTNPIKVLVKAIENAAPREEIVTIEYGGAKYPKAVDCSPQRRIDVALRLFSTGASDRSFNKKLSIEEGLAEEILSAYNLDQKSVAIAKKLELERQADSSR